MNIAEWLISHWNEIGVMTGLIYLIWKVMLKFQERDRDLYNQYTDKLSELGSISLADYKRTKIFITLQDERNIVNKRINSGISLSYLLSAAIVIIFVWYWVTK